MDAPVEIPSVSLPSVNLPSVGLPAQLTPPARELAPLAAELAQEIGLAALIGGNLFGRLALGGALARIGDKVERGKVLNSSWRRYGFVNSLSLALLIGGWLQTRRAELAAPWYRRRDRRLVVIKDAAVGAVAVSGLASAVAGVGFSMTAPEGGVPMESGDEPAAEASPRATRIKRLVNLLGTVNLVAEVFLLALNVLLRRGRTRRLLRR